MTPDAPTVAQLSTSPTAASATVGCTWCGLPVPGFSVRPGTVAAQPSAVIYCCYGCRVAHAITQERGAVGAVRWTIVRLGLSIFFTMNLMAFTMTMWSLDVYDVQPDPFQQKLFEVFRWLSMLLGLPVLILLGLPLLQSAVDSWRQRIFSTDLLIATGVAAAYGISVVNVLQGHSTIYFEVGAMVLVAVTLGRWFEATGRQKATEALDQLAALLPTQVCQLVDGQERQIASADVQVGDHLRVRAGERFPTDGTLISGRTTVDEQVFTGESAPLERGPGAAVLAGTVNLEGDVLVRVTAAFRHGSFGRLLQLLQDARTARGHYQQLADRVSALFFPAITAVSLLTLVWHWPAGAGTAVQHSLSVLLIACPCALGLATPLAVWTALSTAIRHQVLFRSGEAIERMAAAQAICLDKTGTLTTGTPLVARMIRVDGTLTDDEVQRVTEQLAAASRHPFSSAITDYCRRVRPQPGPDQRPATGLSTARLHSLRTVPGAGVEGLSPLGHRLRLGSLTFVVDMPTDGPGDSPHPAVPVRLETPAQDKLAEILQTADREGQSLVALSADGLVQAVFLLSESLRPEARDMLKQLWQLELPVLVLTGDRQPRAARLLTDLQADTPRQAAPATAATISESASAALRIPPAQSARTMAAGGAAGILQIRSELRPEDKVAALLQVREQRGRTIMVGDGINDAPALAASDAGVALGCGADVSRESAHVCLLGNDLRRIPWAIRLARRTRTVIRQNLCWAFGYNAAGVVVAAAGLLNPAVAAAVMIVSSLLVISNSLRLNIFEEGTDTAVPRPPLNTAWQPAAAMSSEQMSTDVRTAAAVPAVCRPESVGAADRIPEEVCG